MAYRIDKVENLIKEEVSLILLYKVQDPTIGFVTITNVKVSPDIKNAKIYLSVFDKTQRAAVLEKVTSLAGMIRSELASRIKIKFVPELRFYIDDTMDYVEKIEGLIKQIHDNKGNQ